jgi:hypothetical protein
MPELSLGPGLTLVHPAGLVAERLGTLARRTPSPRRKSVRDLRAREAPAEGTDLAVLVDALAGQGMELLGQFELKPGSAARGPRRTRGLPGVENTPAEVHLDLAADEDAVVLTVADDDEVDWVLPSGESLSGPVRARRLRARGTARATGGRRTVTFRLAPAGRPARRSRTGKRALGRSVAGVVARSLFGFVFRFARKKVTGLLIGHLEKGVSPGLVRVSSNLPTGWDALGEQGILPRATPTAADGRPRVLLLVHGTFSSTKGSYGGLCFSDEGLAFLNRAQATYDHVIGWDHRTLSEVPRANADQILACLERQAWPKLPVIDAVGFSRGGLVLRTLLERAVPGTRFEGCFQQALFVGCTLNGTRLASADNWKHLVKIYTNIAIAACRGVGKLIPAAVVATVWVETIARGIAAIVKWLATELIDKGGIPGLAAMDPGQAVVKDLNGTPPDADLLSRYRAITNNYEPGASAGDGPEILSPSLKERLVDLAVDTLLHEENDLVVNTSAMDVVGADHLPGLQVFTLGTNGRTIHTTYFRDPRVIAHLSHWLFGDAVPAAVATRGIGTRRLRPRTTAVARGAPARPRAATRTGRTAGAERAAPARKRSRPAAADPSGRRGAAKGAARAGAATVRGKVGAGAPTRGAKKGKRTVATSSTSSKSARPPARRGTKRPSTRGVRARSRRPRAGSS